MAYIKQENENYLYFAGIDGGGGAADGTEQAGCWACSRLAGVTPITATTTGIYFRSGLSDFDGGGCAGDKIVITHNDQTDSEEAGHRCRIIAKAVAEACNAGPNNPGMVTFIDVDTPEYFGDIHSILSDVGFDIVITLDS